MLAVLHAFHLTDFLSGQVKLGNSIWTTSAEHLDTNSELFLHKIWNEIHFEASILQLQLVTYHFSNAQPRGLFPDFSRLRLTSAWSLLQKPNATMEPNVFLATRILAIFHGLFNTVSARLE